MVSAAKSTVIEEVKVSDNYLENNTVKKLKVGFDAKRLFHNTSGLGNYSRTLVSNLKKFFPEHEYHLFVPSLPKNSKPFQQFLEGDYIIHTNESFSPDAWWRTVGCATIINKLDLDIYHGLSHELPFGIKEEIKKIVTFHDVIYAKMPHLFSKIDSIIYNLKYKSASKRANAIVAISESTANDIATLYGVGSKIEVIYQTCDSYFFTQFLHQNSRRGYYLYVGTINERKNLLSVVEAYLLMPIEHQLPFHIIGEGTGYKQKVLNVLKLNKLEKKFIFHGHVDNEGLREYYRGAVALLYPSIYEGFGIPIIEALYNGCPVITSSLSSLPEAVGPGGICIDPSSVSQIAEAMVSISNPATAEGLNRKGYEYVCKKFDPENVTNQLMNFYQNQIS